MKAKEKRSLGDLAVDTFQFVMAVLCQPLQWLACSSSEFQRRNQCLGFM